MEKLVIIFNRFVDWLYTINDPFSIPYKYRRHKSYFSYRKLGDQVFDLVRSQTKNQYLEPTNILDIGCGDGRTAQAFARQNPKLNYIGMDINKKWVDLLNQVYKEKSNYSFIHSNVYNLMYNPNGTDNAIEYIFPFEDNKFDLIILNSVFTHMQPLEATHYLTEIQRLLKDDGTCWCTFMILTNDHDVKYPYADFKHKYDMGDYKTTNKDMPENNVAYDEHNLKRMINEYFEIDKIIYGWWRNIKEVKFDLNKCKQDVLILKKKKVDEK